MIRSRSYSRQRRTAAPIASGRTAKLTLIAQVTTAVAPTATPPRATTDLTTASAAAQATQRSCWRSTPWARRNRTTSDPAPDHHGQGGNGQGELVDHQQHPPWPRRSKGPPNTWYWGSSGPQRPRRHTRPPAWSGESGT